MNYKNFKIPDNGTTNSVTAGITPMSQLLAVSINDPLSTLVSE